MVNWIFQLSAKHRLKPALAALIVMSLPASAAAPWVVNTPAGLNFRELRQGRLVKVTALPTGSTVEWTGRKSGNWAEFTLSDGKKLWAYTKYIRPSDQAPAQPPVEPAAEPAVEPVTAGEAVPLPRPAPPRPAAEPHPVEAAPPQVCTNCTPSIPERLRTEAQKIQEEAAARVDAPQVQRADNAQLANRLAQSAFAAAAKCRDFATFKKRRMGLSTARSYNSCKFFGAQNAYRSKGLCAMGVREAFAEVGIQLPRGNANTKRGPLRNAGFKQVAYDPYRASAGTVLVCDGGGSGYGHIETVVISNGRRLFCSDFCSPRATCNGGYRNRTAFALPRS